MTKRPRTIEVPADLVPLELPRSMEIRLQHLLDCQESGEALASDEKEEAIALVELAEFLTLLNLRALRTSRGDINDSRK